MAVHDDEAVSGDSKNQGFKVVDRRRFDECGDIRQESQYSQSASRAQAQNEDARAETTPSEKIKEETSSSDSSPMPITFSLFVQTLAHQSMMCLGLIPWPDSGQVNVNLQHAKETIDVIGILQEKTKGNLDDSEQRLIDTVLYELRMTFMKILEKDGSK